MDIESTLDGKMDTKLNILGDLEDSYKHEIAEYFVHDFSEKYPNIEAEIYLGYPIYIDEISNHQLCVDIALLSKIGVFIINILNTSVTEYGELQDSIYGKVEEKFKKHSFLYKKRQLIFDIYPITYCQEQILAEDGYPLARSREELINLIDKNKEEEEFSDDLYAKIISGIQEAYGINSHKTREGIQEGTKAFAINKMTKLIERYDSRQMEAILSDAKGIQRIRGMAGSGKTIVLARKAVELHTAHPEWNIVVTYSTRTLRTQLEDLIRRFYASKNNGAKYNSKNLKIMQAWGGATSHGVYYEICLMHGISPLSLNEAKAKYGRVENPFPHMCGDLLKEIDTFHKMYDCILIDEAQDFDKNYLLLCLSVLGEQQRLIYAYDELQALNEQTMPSPEDIFDRGVEHDTPLTVCYRNQGPVIVTAHAIGMGLYRESGLVQLPSSPKVWEAIGYLSDKPIIEGDEVTLYRTKKTSPDYLEVAPTEIIAFLGCDDIVQMFDKLLQMIHDDLTKEQLTPRDMMIIDMDTFGYMKNGNVLINYLWSTNTNTSENEGKSNDMCIHMAGAATPEDFFRNDSIVYSSVRRAKGNECFMVYILNAQKCVSSLQRRSDRNALFTAITRSKGWVRVLGYGKDMSTLCAEFDEIKHHEFKLYFSHYPTKSEQKSIFLNNQDIDDGSARTLDTARGLIEKLSREGRITKRQLIEQLLGMDKDEVRKMYQIGDVKNGAQINPSNFKGY